MKKAIILMLALGFAQTNLSIAQSVQDLESKNSNQELITNDPKAVKKDKPTQSIKKNSKTEEIAAELKTAKTVQNASSIKRKIAKTAMILFLGLVTLYGTDAALEIAVNNLNLTAYLPASFFQYYEFGTLASAANNYLYQIPAHEIHAQCNLFIDKMMPIIKPLQFAATINGIKKFIDEKGKPIKNLGTWIKDTITFNS